ncbi:hypothetical protein [Anaeromicrobium sediminis]|uniref:Head decoration protein n=1 Tax=Anaeromicrobium sediminis TaxID=1478221 RepID=A0A267MQX6_9FIRM|nr:hypothetical protein [Anaeromicrobium sediminis]PAB61325.1 hypothetical protein CCE28_02520 [Anaeromicrobium sediminis]
MKFIKKSYGGVKEILKTKNFEGIPVMVDDTGITADSNGNKIVKAGTIIGGSTKPTLLNENEPVVKKNTQSSTGSDAEGVLLYDVNVTYGPASGSMLIKGNIDLNKIPEQPCEDAKTALLGRVLFMK